MAKADVLDRVAADLARGHTHPAIQRLGSLVAAHPTDLDLRHRLAQLHRRVGDRVQAGRWDYLTPGASTAETAAFERAHPEPAARLRELHWPLRAGAAATEYARARLATLFAATARSVAGRADTVSGSHRPGGSRGGRAPRPARRSARAPLADRAAYRLRGWLFRRPVRVLPLAVIGLVVIGLVGLGAVTVIEWIIQ